MSRKNRAVQQKKMAGGLKLECRKKDRTSYMYMENTKATGRVADLRLFFTYAKSRFSHDGAQIITPHGKTNEIKFPLSTDYDRLRICLI